MSFPYRGAWCSEVTYVPGDARVPADCVAAAGIDSMNCASGGDFRVTAAAREEFRRDCRDTEGGMDLAHLQLGYGVHGFVGTYFGTLPAIQKALETGWSLVMLGWMDALPKALWFQRHGHVYHAVHFNGGDKAGWVHLAQPLAPANHPGTEVPIELALKYALSTPGGFQVLGLREGSATAGGNIGGEPMINAQDISVGSGYVIANIPKGTDFFDGPGGARLGSFSATATVSYVGAWGAMYAGLVPTGAPYVDKATRPTIVAIAKGKGTVRPKNDAELAAQALAYHACPADGTPYSQVDLDAAKAAEHEKTRQQAIDAVEAI